MYDKCIIETTKKTNIAKSEVLSTLLIHKTILKLSYSKWKTHADWVWKWEKYVFCSSFVYSGLSKVCKHSFVNSIVVEFVPFLFNVSRLQLKSILKAN